LKLQGNDRTTRITKVSAFAGRIPAEVPECLIVIYGENLGKKFELVDDIITIGREPDNTIVLASDSVSRKHARIEKIQNQRFIVDLGSTNGTLVNDVPVKARARLESGCLIKIGETIFRFIAGDHIEALYFEEIYKVMVTDGLTQCANKRALEDFLEREMARARRHKRPLSVVMMDLDHFKEVNDNYGHLVGDTVLREVAHVIKQRVRREELFARYGGEEFVAVLPETPREGALEFAEAIRKIVEAIRIVVENNETIKVTMSLGVATFDPEQHQGVSDLIKSADRNLYIAKSKGRNCVYG
jgi:diguanylate cyclase (GGDEF)-like protein